MASPKHSPEHDALGRTVRFLRAKAGWSQEELGFRARLHRNYIGAIERGEINPTFAVLLRLTGGLGLPLSELLREFERLVKERRDRGLPPAGASPLAPAGPDQRSGHGRS
jgi:transcriptional regulator with XRE-family HTH domain